MKVYRLITCDHKQIPSLFFEFFGHLPNARHIFMTIITEDILIPLFKVHVMKGLPARTRRTRLSIHLILAYRRFKIPLLFLFHFLFW